MSAKPQLLNFHSIKSQHCTIALLLQNYLSQAWSSLQSLEHIELEIYNQCWKVNFCLAKNTHLIYFFPISCWFELFCKNVLSISHYFKKLCTEPEDYSWIFFFWSDFKLFRLSSCMEWKHLNKVKYVTHMFWGKHLLVWLILKFLAHANHTCFDFSNVMSTAVTFFIWPGLCQICQTRVRRLKRPDMFTHSHIVKVWWVDGPLLWNLNSL